MRITRNPIFFFFLKNNKLRVFRETYIFTNLCEFKHSQIQVISKIILTCDNKDSHQQRRANSIICKKAIKVNFGKHFQILSFLIFTVC